MSRLLRVYLHTELEVRSLHKSLQAQLGGWEVLVYGRRRDFERDIGSSTNAVLAIRPVVDSIGRSIALQGSRGGSKKEPYVLLGRDTVRPANVSSLGMVDLFGRRKTAEFAHGLLGGSPRVELVSKVVDLVALLRFKKADAVVIPERLVGATRSRTEMSLVVTKLPHGSVGLPAVAVADGKDELLSRFRSFSSSLNAKLGVTSWL